MDEARKYFVTLVVVFVLGVAAGAAGMYFGRPAQLRVERIEVPVVTEKIRTVTTTDVQYVPKEIITVIERDPATGQETAAQKQEDTDVDVKINRPSVNVKVNDRPYQFSLLQGEAQKFEAGKVSLQQTSDISLRIEVKPEDKTKKRSIGLGSLGGEMFGSLGYTPNNVIEYKLIGNQDKQGGMVELRF